MIDEALKERIDATYILCGSIGFEEHLKMETIKTLSKVLGISEKEMLNKLEYEFIPHCEHVKNWLDTL